MDPWPDTEEHGLALMGLGLGTIDFSARAKCSGMGTNVSGLVSIELGSTSRLELAVEDPNKGVVIAVHKRRSL